MDTGGPWLSFWTWLLILSIAAFAILAIVVAIGGAFDIRTLFRNLGARHDEDDHV